MSDQSAPDFEKARRKAAFMVRTGQCGYTDHIVVSRAYLALLNEREEREEALRLIADPDYTDIRQLKDVARRALPATESAQAVPDELLYDEMIREAAAGELRLPEESAQAEGERG